MNKIGKYIGTGLVALALSANSVDAEEGDLGRKLYTAYNIPIKFMEDVSATSTRSQKGIGMGCVGFASGTKMKVLGEVGPSGKMRILYIDESSDGKVDEVWIGPYELGETSVTSLNTYDEYRKPTQRDQENYVELEKSAEENGSECGTSPEDLVLIARKIKSER